MSVGGAGGYDYRNEVQQSLQGANLPKSALSQQYNAYAQNVAPSIFESLLNAQNLGNSSFGGQIGPTRQVPLSQGHWQDKQYNFSGYDPNNGIQTNQPPDLTNHPTTSGTVKPDGTTDSGGIGGGLGKFGGYGGAAGIRGFDPNAFPGQSGMNLGGDAGIFGGGQFHPGQYNPSAPWNAPTLDPISQNGPSNPNGLNLPRFMGANNQPEVGGIGQILQQLLGAAGNNPRGQLGNFNPTSPNLSSLQGQINPQDSQYYQSIADVLGQKQNRDVADMRARFGGSGTSRGTPAMQAESLLRSQQLPELAQALGGVRQSEFGNELQRRGQVQSGMLTQSDQYNTSTLGGRGQDLQALLGGGGLNAQNLQTLLGGVTNLRGQDIQNNQFNSGQYNSQQNMIAQMQQQAIESQLQRQFTGLQNLLQGGLGLSMAGMPGGSANVNLTGGPQQGSGFGSSLSGIGSLITALGNL